MTNIFLHSDPVRQDFFRRLQALWPALKGSLALVRKPCIRPNCPACARGDKHPVFIRSFTDKGRRRCVHVPTSLAPLIRQAIRNGRKMEALLYRNGPARLRQRRDP